MTIDVDVATTLFIGVSYKNYMPFPLNKKIPTHLITLGEKCYT